MKRILFIAIAAAALLNSVSLQAGDPFREIDRKWTDLQGSLDAQWDVWNKDLLANWERLRKDVELKWQTFAHSTNKEWVEYDQKREARGLIDFQNGKIVFEAVIAEGDDAASEKAKKRIDELATRVFAEQDQASNRILESQVVDRKGQRVGPQNLETYLNKEVLPEVKAEPSPYESRDGIKRRKYTATIELVPEHIRLRAERYRKMVSRNAARFKIKPQLIMAVIHTESFFNPKAISHCNAIGMMQIIPVHAGREAYQFVYGKDMVLGPEYLFVPEQNIELGSAYLHLLTYRHFRDVAGEVKNRYVAVCGYNWGPTKMRTQIVGKYKIGSMEDEDVYQLLREKTPAETREYVKRVRERMPSYDPFFP